jgi:hypothetical protein
MQICVSILLSVYIFIFLVPPGLVPHSEHDHIGQLDKALESDPCHIAMFHPGELGGCNHKSHFTKDPGDCPLCHVTLVRQIVPDPIHGLAMVQTIIPVEFHYPARTVVLFPILHDDRGPPSAYIS